MERTQLPARPLAHLPPGTRVGPWRVVAWAGRGVHGAVYRAVRVGQEHSGPVALKVALLPADPRFAREVELLSRLRHPSVPRLLDSGQWRHSSGASHPYIAMNWVDGLPLYDWGRQHAPTPAQVLGLLAQLASALQELHAQGGVHRDLKGDNILVRRSDGRAVLTDFGSGIYPGASALTPPAWYPGTPAYRSPEAALLELHSLQAPSARHAATPADDLYSLGVTACRLLTGEYPQPGELTQDEYGTWHVASVSLPPALSQVEPNLRALILRLLSVRPEERGTTAQLTEALEQNAEFSQTSAPSPSCATGQEHTAQAANITAPRKRIHTQPSSWPQWLALAALTAVALAAWASWLGPSEPTEQLSTIQREAAQAEKKEASTAGLAETAVAPLDSSASRAGQRGMAEDAPPEPVPGQTRPDATGHCPRKRQVALNGGCWRRLMVDPEECEDLHGHMFKAACYVAVTPAGRQPTSHPAPKP